MNQKQIWVLITGAFLLILAFNTAPKVIYTERGVYLYDPERHAHLAPIPEPITLVIRAISIIIITGIAYFITARMRFNSLQLQKFQPFIKLVCHEFLWFFLFTFTWGLLLTLFATGINHKLTLPGGLDDWKLITIPYLPILLVRIFLSTIKRKR